jgi:DNA-binding NarL/FixJ family response regulator
LIGAQLLLAEGLQLIFQKMEDVDLIGPWELNLDSIDRILASQPDVVLVADQDLEKESTLALMAQILEMFPDLTVMRVTLSQDVVRAYTAHTTPARSTDLMEFIRALPARDWSKQD